MKALPLILRSLEFNQVPLIVGWKFENETKVGNSVSMLFAKNQKNKPIQLINALLLVRRPEYEWPNPLGVGRFKPEHPAKKLEDDYDVFGDGRDGHLRLNARVIVNHFI